MVDRKEIDALMKRCQRGVGGRNAMEEAHDIMAACYGTLGRLMLDLEQVATIAHDGGLAGLSESQAMSHIRRLTLPHWDTRGLLEERRRRVSDAASEALERAGGLNSPGKPPAGPMGGAT